MIAAMSPLQYIPIGVARTPFTEKNLAPRQGVVAQGVQGTLELLDVTGHRDALEGLETFSHLHVLFHFDRDAHFVPKVRPPRSDRKRGVLATRSPHRPNAIGLTVVRLLRVEGLVLHVAELDLLDGTPILDIKPYLAYADAFPHASHGWLEVNLGASGDTEAPADPARYRVTLSDRLERQLNFLSQEGEAIRARIVEQLSLGPAPHAYRRIRKVEAGLELALKEWRVHFSVTGREVLARDLVSGFRMQQLYDPRSRVPAEVRALHARFVEEFAPATAEPLER
jgi:tRNA-Thr(GGU) m(6)t(6)A37 methyltransferase TsaA